MPSSSNIGCTIVSPGKIVIAGEYAVLDGSPAIVLAINRGVRCDILAGTGIRTPNGDTRYVEPILQQQSNRAHYFFQDWNPVTCLGEAQKPGFGGSAAACVAACLAANIPLKEAFDFHRSIQGGGSGIDIAASIYGGMLRFQGGKIEQLTPIHPVVIWSGQSAQTGPRVRQYLQWKEREHFVARSAALTTSFQQDPIQTFRSLHRLLTHAMQQCHVHYMTPALQKIIALAEAAGGGAKASVAGGGDCAIALFSHAEQRQRFLAMCQTNSFTTIPIQPASGAHFIEPNHV